MSWKGFQKAMSRLPHQIMSKKEDATRDMEFIELEKRFNDASKLADQLKAEGQAFRDGVSALLTNQADMASFISTIYTAQIGIETEEGEVQRRLQQTPAVAVQAAADAEAAMAYCREEVLAQLDVIDSYVIRPSQEIQEIVKQIQKTIVKRNHKLIDYDRHRVNLNKLTVKEERSMSEEKQIFKVQSQLETATQDYDYLNNALKRDLPHFFTLKAQFIQPVFEQMFYLQCKVYGMIYARCYELLNANEQHFVTQSMEIEQGYQWRKSQFDAQKEIENSDLIKAGGKAWLSASGGANSSKLTLQERSELKRTQSDAQPFEQQPATSSYHHQEQAYQQPVYQQQPSYQQPAYQQQPITNNNTNTASYSNNYSTTNRAPPVPPPSRKPNNIHYVLALYDYDAQAEGDLSFKKDDKIELIERTADENDWWTGKLNGMTGIFPGNYVTEL